jgi:hypothetical protein
MADKNSQIFATGTMRTGGSLVQNLLSVHSEVLMFAGFVSFFRFYYKQYEPLNPENVERMIHHLRIRLKCRRDFDLDAELIIGNILKRHVSYRVCYQEIMNYLAEKTEKPSWGEYVTLGWRRIPDYLEMYPNAKVVHIYRDIRAIVSSFGRVTNMPDNLYLQAIFNWIDSVNHIKKYSSILPKNQYYVLKFEEIHSNPESKIKELCEFLEIPFENAMIEPERWDALFDKNFVDANISSYSKKKVYGFDSSRSERWKNEISDWELNLCEHLAKEQLAFAGYEKSLLDLNPIALKKGMDELRNNSVLSKSLQHFELTGEGTDKAAMDPTDPANWDAPGDAFTKFTAASVYSKYVKEHEDLEEYLKAKYRA